MKYSQTSLPYKVLKNIRDNDLISAGDEVVVALSGGADSVCLFDILFNLKNDLKFLLAACHFNHKLRGQESERDKKFVQNFCKERGVECILGEAPEKNLYKNEEEARDARYALFEKIVGERRGAKIAIAHNSNDLAETFLQRLARGSGIGGLKSIPLTRKNYIRPLLYFSRSEIEKYLKDNGLEFVVDRTNIDTRYSRNFIRAHILPAFSKLNPNFIDTLAGNIQNLEDDYQLIEEIAQKKYREIAQTENGRGILNRKKWLSLPPAIKRFVLRIALSELSDLRDITAKQIAETVKIIEKGTGGKHKILPHSLRIELESGKIIIYKER